MFIFSRSKCFSCICLWVWSSDLDGEGSGEKKGGPDNITMRFVWLCAYSVAPKEIACKTYDARLLPPSAKADPAPGKR